MSDSISDRANSDAKNLKTKLEYNGADEAANQMMADIKNAQSMSTADYQKYIATLDQSLKDQGLLAPLTIGYLDNHKTSLEDGSGKIVQGKLNVTFNGDPFSTKEGNDPLSRDMLDSSDTQLLTQLGNGGITPADLASKVDDTNQSWNNVAQAGLARNPYAMDFQTMFAQNGQYGTLYDLVDSIKQPFDDGTVTSDDIEQTIQRIVTQPAYSQWKTPANINTLTAIKNELDASNKNSDKDPSKNPFAAYVANGVLTKGSIADGLGFPDQSTMVKVLPTVTFGEVITTTDSRSSVDDN